VQQWEEGSLQRLQQDLLRRLLRDSSLRLALQVGLRPAALQLEVGLAFRVHLAAAAVDRARDL
jgi:hypothetical protein